ncbi:hypothetical protein RFI_19752 [Reticulomyxa filosa]|uniref:Uncharacterized protein n=1 Tax=Reticulomyxa filosa TaxID=46433 RepID=X6MVT5_RETFI|nr:hypothetical protein RFI_19752 [Reticulomyxa filosa]|eukprot:ETO17572.1 hypothetical protein RFI_19752 [Reticulomyxa filosa]
MVVWPGIDDGNEKIEDSLCLGDVTTSSTKDGNGCHVDACDEDVFGSTATATATATWKQRVLELLRAKPAKSNLKKGSLFGSCTLRVLSSNVNGRQVRKTEKRVHFGIVEISFFEQRGGCVSRDGVSDEGVSLHLGNYIKSERKTIDEFEMEKSNVRAPMDRHCKLATLDPHDDVEEEFSLLDSKTKHVGEMAVKEKDLHGTCGCHCKSSNMVSQHEIILRLGEYNPNPPTNSFLVVAMTDSMNCPTLPANINAMDKNGLLHMLDQMNWPKLNDKDTLGLDRHANGNGVCSCAHNHQSDCHNEHKSRTGDDQSNNKSDGDDAFDEDCLDMACCIQPPPSQARSTCEPKQISNQEWETDLCNCSNQHTRKGQFHFFASVQ